jgi:hypothetical protein
MRSTKSRGASPVPSHDAWIDEHDDQARVGGLIGGLLHRAAY